MSLDDEPILKRIEGKLPNNLRLISFNVNGINTLFNYHPWNKINNDLNKLFTTLDGDIITLQELKLTNSSLSSNCKYLGHLRNYKSFITLPKIRKGYSGVGVFVRIPDESESEEIKSLLVVTKVEEGITGWLTSPETNMPYRDSSCHIGGYASIKKSEGLILDQEGRCILVELANDVVIISVYCPANSMQTPEGELFRILFLTCLFTRCGNLHAIGKKVILMGDINIALNLIDSHDEIQSKLLARSIKKSGPDSNFEIINYEECMNFKKSTKARKMLNDIVHCQINKPRGVDTLTLDSQFFYDTTRQAQGRKLNMYTVWNTMTDTRSRNCGSRIDLILATKELSSKVTQSNIWPYILGSDHCPLFTDFEMTKNVIAEVIAPKKLLFEAKYFYKLVKDKDVMGMLFRKPTIIVKEDKQSIESGQDKIVTVPITNKVIQSVRTINHKEIPNTQKITKPKLVYQSRKVKKVTKIDEIGQKSINSFFKN